MIYGSYRHNFVSMDGSHILVGYTELEMGEYGYEVNKYSYYIYSIKRTKVKKEDVIKMNKEIEEIEKDPEKKEVEEERRNKLTEAERKAEDEKLASMKLLLLERVFKDPTNI